MFETDRPIYCVVEMLIYVGERDIGLGGGIGTGNYCHKFNIVCMFLNPVNLVCESNWVGVTWVRSIADDQRVRVCIGDDGN